MSEKNGLKQGNHRDDVLADNSEELVASRLTSESPERPPELLIDSCDAFQGFCD